MQQADEQNLKCNMRTDMNPHQVFMFLPELSATLTHSNPKASWEGVCFKQISAELLYEPNNTESVHINITLSDAKSLTCREHFLWGNTEI
jgi:hypothetical protein